MKKHINNLFLAAPTLADLIQAADCPKALADRIGIEASNFRKHCNNKGNFQIETFAQCAAAFERDVVIVLIPKGIVSTIIEEKSSQTSCQVISEEQFMDIVHAIEAIKQKELEEQLGSIVQYACSGMKERSLWLLIRLLEHILSLLKKLIEHGREEHT
jgi:hypothetical protein